ncbi:MAG: methylated-DNA--[protein]-cysteine S-methyltransferase [bacterium]|nr:methylated-DNA--[protein]-cysteine S-methyltransferase [bacterium]
METAEETIRLRSTWGTWSVLLSGGRVVRLRLPPAPPRRGTPFRWNATARRPALRRLMASVGRRLAGDGRLLRPPPARSLVPPFTAAVRRRLCEIPFGATATYAEIAAAAGSPLAARAVGNACAANPFPVLIPCHRATAAGGVGGFSAGAAWKRFLLGHEARLLPRLMRCTKYEGRTTICVCRIHGVAGPRPPGRGGGRRKKCIRRRRVV